MTGAALVSIIADIAGGVSAGDIAWGNVITYGVTSLLTSSLTWVIAARISTAVLREQNVNLAASVNSLRDDMGRMFQKIDRNTADRYQCEIHAAKTYATQDQFVQCLSTVSASHAELMSVVKESDKHVNDSVRRLHDRMNEQGERMSAIEAGTGRTL